MEQTRRCNQAKLTSLSRLEKARRPFLSLDDVRTIGTLQSQPTTITDARLQGNLIFPGGNSHQLADQFGGPNQVGVVGYTLGSAPNSVFHGEKP